MDDKKLLEYYLSLRDPEAGKWNLSPASLYVECECRHYFQSRITLWSGVRVCNIGIGTGDWDDFLGYELEANGQLTSVDIDPEICDIFRYRQLREGHPRPSTVICCDILDNPLNDRSFDIITIIGSTMNEIGQIQGTFEQCKRLLDKDGILMVMDFHKYHHLEEYENIAKDMDFMIMDEKVYTRFENLEFYIITFRQTLEEGRK